MKKYFLHDGINQYGPFDLADLEAKIITPQTLIWYESLPDWKPAGEIDELKSLLNSKIPASQITSPPIVSKKEEDWSKKSYYYSDDHGQQGPFTLEQLKNRAIKGTTPVWYDPLSEWTTADKVPGLKDIISVTVTTTTVVSENGTTNTTQRQYYYMYNAAQQGPFSLEQLKGKGLNHATSVWYEPLTEWTTADKIAELKDILTLQPAPSTQRLYYYMANGAQQGPFTLEQLRGKGLNTATSVWYDPLTQWTTADKIDELKGILTSATTVAPQGSTQRLYYYMANGAQQGPFSIEQLKGKGINAATSVWYDPLPQWTTAGQIPELKEVITSLAAATVNTQRLYYYMANGAQQGPFSLEQLKGRGIIASTSVWYDPLPQWTTAGQLPELSSVLGSVSTAPAAPQHSGVQRLYYYMANGTQQGPFSTEQLKGKGINASTSVWYDPLPQWTTAGQIPELKDVLNSTGSTFDWSKTLFYYTDAAGQQGPFTVEQLRGRGLTSATAVWYDPLPKWTTAGQVEGLRSILVG